MILEILPTGFAEDSLHFKHYVPGDQGFPVAYKHHFGAIDVLDYPHSSPLRQVEEH